MTTSTPRPTVTFATGVDPATITVLAEPTNTPGLAVTPELVYGRLSGNWMVTHTASGYTLPVDKARQARAVAAALGLPNSGDPR